MKIQAINNGTNQISSPKNVKAPGTSFEHVLKNHIKNDNPERNNAAQSNPGSSAEQIESARRLTISNMRQVNMTGLKELVKDAFSDTGTQILHEIESLCDDEAGENIDMKLLDELLELYEETR